MSEKETETKQQEEAVEKLARHYRHIGYAFFICLALLVSFVLTHSAITGCTNNTVFDPFTGEIVEK